MELHLLFLDSNNQVCKEVLKNPMPNLSPKVIKTVMKEMVALDVGERDGTRRHAVAAAAKYVEVREEILFDDSDKIVAIKPVPQPVSAEEETSAEETVEEETPKKERRKSQPAEPKITLSTMTRCRPKVLAAKMKEEFSGEIMRLRMTKGWTRAEFNAPVDRYLSNALKSQALNELLQPTKQIDPYVFNQFMEYLFRIDWTPYLLAHLKDLQQFFPPQKWLELMELFPEKGRENLANLLDKGEGPDHEAADAEIKAVQVEARAAFIDFEKRQSALPGLMSQLCL